MSTYQPVNVDKASLNNQFRSKALKTSSGSFAPALLDALNVAGPTAYTAFNQTGNGLGASVVGAAVQAATQTTASAYPGGAGAPGGVASKSMGMPGTAPGYNPGVVNGASMGGSPAGGGVGGNPQDVITKMGEQGLTLLGYQQEAAMVGLQLSGMSNMVQKQQSVLDTIARNFRA